MRVNAPQLPWGGGGGGMGAAGIDWCIILEISISYSTLPEEDSALTGSKGLGTKVGAFEKNLGKTNMAEGSELKLAKQKQGFKTLP